MPRLESPRPRRLKGTDQVSGSGKRVQPNPAISLWEEAQIDSGKRGGPADPALQFGGRKPQVTTVSVYYTTLKIKAGAAFLPMQRPYTKKLRGHRRNLFALVLRRC